MKRFETHLLSNRHPIHRIAENRHSRKLAVAKSRPLPPVAESMRAYRWAYTPPHRGDSTICCVDLLQAVATCYAGIAQDFSPYSERGYPVEVLGTAATMALGAG